jgi:hypothetical protein
VIQLIEHLCGNVRQQEEALGKEAFSNIAQAAGNAVDQFRTNLKANVVAVLGSS